MKVFFIVPYPQGVAPSQRFRFEHYLDYIREQGVEFSVSSFLDLKAWNNLYKKGHLASKVWATCKGFLRRLCDLFLVYRYDFIYIHREATPLGPAWFEWFAARVFKKKIIYDFDDAIWIPTTSDNNRYVQGLRNFGKVKKICRWSHLVVTGNEFLKSFATKYNANCLIIPTVVDTEHVHNRVKDQENMPAIIGWTGTFSTLQYLNMILPAISEIQKKYKFQFIVIADKDPQPKLPFYRFIQWNKETEIDDLLKFNIGVMPLEDTELAKGKCGFKAIQYMALGIPALVSPVGVNTEIVDDGKDGFICKNTIEWENNMLTLLESTEKRKDMGSFARKKIKEHYSVLATKIQFLSIFGG